MIGARPPASPRAALAAYGYALVVAAVLGYFLLGMTVQVSDSFGNLLSLQRPSLVELVSEQFYQRAFLRPLLWAQLKVVYEIADGRYYQWFRGIHAAQVLLLVLLCVRLMRPRTLADAALVPLGLAVLVGIHTFAPTVREGFPINTFMTILLCCAGAACLVFGRHRWWTDVLACGLFVFGALTVESGLLVWVVCAAGFLLGRRGVSAAGLAAMTALLAAYVVVRMLLLDVGTPGLEERASGLGFHVIEGADLAKRFGGNPWPFYAYNVLSSISTVLFSEPKGGVWRFLYEITLRNLHPWTVVSVLSSTTGTAVVAWYAWSRRGAWRRRELNDDDRLVLLFAALLVANAVMSYPYAKNAVMSPAGVFYALAVFAASRGLLAHAATGGARRAAAAAVVFALLSAGWAFRAAGLHYNLRRTAAIQRNEWVFVDDEWLARQRLPAEQHAEARELRETLRRDAIWTYRTPPQPAGIWTRWFDIDW